MDLILNIPVSDEDLVCALASRNTLRLVGGQADWREIERQVEKLGFGDLCVVAETKAGNTATPRVTITPVSPVSPVSPVRTAA
jgi:hypothetical protein